MPFESLRREARDYYIQMENVSLYKMDGNKLDDLVCVAHSLKSEAWTSAWSNRTIFFCASVGGKEEYF